MSKFEDRREELVLPFIDAFSTWRKKNVISQFEVAKEAGMTTTYMSLVENGWRLPHLETMLLLCSAARVPRGIVEDLVDSILGKLEWG
jgi:transcriptional regulator with XRE-family HTH domain